MRALAEWKVPLNLELLRALSDRVPWITGPLASRLEGKDEDEDSRPPHPSQSSPLNSHPESRNPPFLRGRDMGDTQEEGAGGGGFADEDSFWVERFGEEKQRSFPATSEQQAHPSQRLVLPVPRPAGDVNLSEAAAGPGQPGRAGAVRQRDGQRLHAGVAQWGEGAPSKRRRGVSPGEAPSVCGDGEGPVASGHGGALLEPLVRPWSRAVRGPGVAPLTGREAGEREQVMSPLQAALARCGTLVQTLNHKSSTLTPTPETTSPQP